MFPKIVVPLDLPFLIGFFNVNHPFWGTTIFGNTYVVPPSPPPFPVLHSVVLIPC